MVISFQEHLLPGSLPTEHGHGVVHAKADEQYYIFVLLLLPMSLQLSSLRSSWAFELTLNQLCPLKLLSTYARSTALHACIHR